MRLGLAIGLIVTLAGGIAAAVVFWPHLPPAERGRRVAERVGCFGCHGPGGIRGAQNPGRLDQSVPTFEGDVMMFAETPEEIHAWIHEGVTESRAKSKTWQREREAGVLKMPAFKGRLSEGEMEDLVAFVMASSGTPEPEDSLAARGLARAEALGCVGCHGAGGRLALRNPGSLKGYVPSWDGAEFPELVRDRDEFDEWVKRGVSRRFERNPLAQYFLKRANLAMPPYDQHLEPGDLDALWAYVDWLRSDHEEVEEAAHTH